MADNVTLKCLSSAGHRLAIRGMIMAASVVSNSLPRGGHYLADKITPSLTSSDDSTNSHCNDPTMLENNQNRIALFGVSDLNYIPKYLTTFASIGCDEDRNHEVDYYLLIHDKETASIHRQEKYNELDSFSHSYELACEMNERWTKEAPQGLLSARITYVPIDFSLSFSSSTFHGAWPSVAYWWAAGPEMFGAAGYKTALYLDGDVIASPSYSIPYCNNVDVDNVGASGAIVTGGLTCNMIRSELAPMLQGDGYEYLLAGSIESSLGVMLGALGGDDSMWNLHEIGLGISVNDLFTRKLTVNTGVLLFSTAQALSRHLFEDTIQLAKRCAILNLSLFGDMHILALLFLLSNPTQLDSSRAEDQLVGILKPVSSSWNYRFTKNNADLSVEGNSISFKYNRGYEIVNDDMVNEDTPVTVSIPHEEGREVTLTLQFNLEREICVVAQKKQHDKLCDENISNYGIVHELDSLKKSSTFYSLGFSLVNNRRDKVSGIQTLEEMRHELNLKFLHFTWAKPWSWGQESELLHKRYSDDGEKEDIWGRERVRMAKYWHLVNQSVFQSEAFETISLPIAVHDVKKGTKTKVATATTFSKTVLNPSLELYHEPISDILSASDEFKKSQKVVTLASKFIENHYVKKVNEKYDQNDVDIQVQLSSIISEHESLLQLMPIDISLHVLNGPISDKIRDLYPSNRFYVCRHYKTFRIVPKLEEQLLNFKFEDDTVFNDTNFIEAKSNDEKCFSLFQGEKLTPLIIEKSSIVHQNSPQISCCFEEFKEKGRNQSQKSRKEGVDVENKLQQSEEMSTIDKRCAVGGSIGVVSVELVSSPLNSNNKHTSSARNEIRLLEKNIKVCLPHGDYSTEK